MHLVNTQTIQKVNINQKEKNNCVRMFQGVHVVREIVKSMEPTLHPEYWKETTVNSATKQHSQNPIKNDQLTTAESFGNGF